MLISVSVFQVGQLILTELSFVNVTKTWFFSTKGMNLDFCYILSRQISKNNNQQTPYHFSFYIAANVNIYLRLLWKYNNNNRNRKRRFHRKQIQIHLTFSKSLWKSCVCFLKLLKLKYREFSLTTFSSLSRSLFNLDHNIQPSFVSFLLKFRGNIFLSRKLKVTSMKAHLNQ